jgi:hypothetical protein
MAAEKAGISPGLRVGTTFQAASAVSVRAFEFTVLEMVLSFSSAAFSSSSV